MFNPLSSGKSKGKGVVEDVVDSTTRSDELAVVEVARFNGLFMVGREMEPLSSVSNGQTFRGGVLQVTYLNDVFMSIKFVGASKGDYVQLVPWSSIATVILK